jgi:hypothetical protein
VSIPDSRSCAGLWIDHHVAFRQAFPENCFRKLSALDLQHPQATHERLLRCGQPLSYKDDPSQTLSSERETLVYLKECNNPRLHSLLANLVRPKHI